MIRTIKCKDKSKLIAMIKRFGGTDLLKSVELVDKNGTVEIIGDRKKVEMVLSGVCLLDRNVM